MSWSLNVNGKPEELQQKVVDLLKAQKCAEPEESIKNMVGDIIDLSLQAMSSGKNVDISANGSQSSDPTNPKRMNNTLKLSISYS